jgi:hypothetical protein
MRERKVQKEDTQEEKTGRKGKQKNEGLLSQPLGGRIAIPKLI